MGFSDNLKRVRLRTGMTQQQVADALGITKSTYCGYETGKRQPDIAKLRKLALQLCISVDALLGLVDDNSEYTVSPQEYERILLFRQLDSHAQRLLRLTFEEELARVRSTAQRHSQQDLLPLRIALQPANGNQGVYLGPDGFRTAMIRQDALPSNASFGLPVSGSMLEPLYHDGEVLVVSGDRPQPGHVGVFMCNGLGVIRMMGSNELLSMDSSRDAQPLDASIRHCGTIVGTLSPADIVG